MSIHAPKRRYPKEEKAKKVKVVQQPGYREMNRLRNGKLESSLDKVDWRKMK